MRLTLNLDSESFDGSITGDTLDSVVQVPNFRLVVAWHEACMMLYIAYG